MIRAVAGRLRRPAAQLRQMSSGPSGGGGGKAFAVGAGVGLAALGGTAAYAGLDADFRKSVEQTVPGSGTLLSAVLGDPEPPKVDKKVKDASTTLRMTSSAAAPPSKKRSVPVEEKVIVEPPPAPPLEAPPTPRPVKEERPDREDARKKVLNGEKPKQDTVKEEKLKAPKLEASKPIDLEDEPTIEAGKDHHKKVSEIKEDLQRQMVFHLKRQAEAHADHLADALEVQQREIKRSYATKLDEALEHANLIYAQELSKITGHLKGLNEALESRSSMDAASMEAQELWLACSSLLQALSPGTYNEEVRPLKEELASVRKAVGQRDAFVDAVLSSLPEVVERRGVYTEDSIRNRFRKVETVAKRTAMVGEDGGSLAKYAMSYLQSMLVLSPPTEEMPCKSEAIDVDALNTFDIVWLARGSLERGDVEQSVKYMTLLKGEPRHVASDWIREAQTLLETRQACLALMAHAAAVGVEALPQRE